MSVSLRTGRAEDAPAIARVHVRSWRATYAQILSAQFLAGLDEQVWAERWRGRLTQPKPLDACLVMLEHDELIGFIAVGSAGKDESESTGELRAIYVDPQCTGRGLGRQLLQAGMGALRAAGFRDAVLWVADANRQARTFYEREGWRAVGEPVGHTVSGATIMSRRYEFNLLSSRQNP